MSEVFSGQIGEVYYTSLNILVSMLLFLLSGQLLLHRKKRAYFTLAICMGLLLIVNLVTLCFVLLGNTHFFDIATPIISTIAFILANMGVFQLFGETTKRLTRGVLVLIVLACILSIVPLGAAAFQLILIVLAYYIVYPLVQKRMYILALCIYTVATVAQLSNVIIASPLVYLQAVENLFRVVFYSLIFVILFNRVIDLMENIYRKSTRDALTNLYNRFYFYTTVSFLMNENKPISIMFFDLDNFKKLNDTLGHDVGDQTLKQVAMILKEESDDIGIAGRYGGEEMVIMIEDSETNVSELGEKIRYRIESETSVTASIGYAEYEAGLSPDQLIKNADEAMYLAKKTGKNKLISYNQIKEQIDNES